MDGYRNFSQCSNHINSLIKNGILRVNVKRFNADGEFYNISIDSDLSIKLFSNFNKQTAYQEPSRELLREVVIDYIKFLYATNRLDHLENEAGTDIETYSKILFESLLYALEEINQKSVKIDWL